MSNPRPATAPAPRPAALLWTSLGLLAAFAAMAAAVVISPRSPFTQPLDDWWRSAVGVAPESSMYTWFLPMFFQHLGEGLGLVMLAGIVVGLALVGRWRSALFIIASTVVSGVLLIQVTKNLVDRPRPAFDETVGLYGPLFAVDHGSFPSGHAATAAVLAFGIAALIPPTRVTARRVWWVFAILLMIGMIWQRTLVNAHWFSDTIFGLVAGAAGTLLLWWVDWPMIQQDYARPIWFLHRRMRLSNPDAIDLKSTSA